MDLCDKYLYESIKIYPPLNDYLQYNKYSKKQGILPNHLNLKFNKKSNKIDCDILKELKKKKELTSCEEILLYDLEFEDKFKSFYSSDYLLDIEENILFIYYNICINKLPPLSNKKLYLMIMNRLKSLSGITNNIIDILENGIKYKVFINRIIIDSFLNKSRTILDDKINPNGVPGDIKSIFIKSINKNIINNIKKLNQFILNKYLSYSIDKLGLCAYVGGKKYYENICKYDTLPNLTPEVIHDFGIKELKRDILLKKKLSKKVGCDDIDDYMYGHNKFYGSSKEILKDLEKQRDTMYSKLSKYFYQDIDKLYDIKSISEQNMDMTAYYVGPNKGNGGKGTFFINILHPDKISKYELLVLSIHEGIPGHHYEGEIQYKSDKSDYVKNKVFSGYSEGWALYCESLYEYTNWKEYYYSLQYRVERSLRLIIDTGIHYYGWNYDKCFSYMKKYMKYESDSFIHDQILRYSANPGQALTYKIGEQVILFLKREFMKRNSDIKAFHKIILDIGPCPLELLIEKFRENIM